MPEQQLTFCAFLKKDSYNWVELNISCTSKSLAICDHTTSGISLWHCRSYISRGKALELPSHSLAWQLNHIFYGAAGDIVLFPHFWVCSPSALLVCHHLLKSIYCSPKSILLSEERCRFWGYGSPLSHFLSLFLTHTHHTNKQTVMAKVPVCLFFWVSHILGRVQA